MGGKVFQVVIARSEATEAIHPFLTRRDGLLRFARNDGGNYAEIAFAEFT